MNFSIRRVNALLTKEFRDFCKNPNVLFMMLIPIALTVFYKYMFKGHALNGFLVSICLDMNIATIGCLVIAMLIAEEKEKNTLRTLMLSPLTTAEFITGKFIITGILVMIINVFIFFVLGVSINNLPVFIIATLLATIGVLFIGALIGILSKDQMQTGTIGTPFYMVLFILPMIAYYDGIPRIVKYLAEILPTYHCSEIVIKFMKGQSLLSMKFNFLAMILWIAGAYILFSLVYKKVRTEE